MATDPFELRVNVEPLRMPRVVLTFIAPDMVIAPPSSFGVPAPVRTLRLEALGMVSPLPVIDASFQFRMPVTVAPLNVIVLAVPFRITEPDVLEVMLPLKVELPSMAIVPGPVKAVPVLNVPPRRVNDDK